MNKYKIKNQLRILYRAIRYKTTKKNIQEMIHFHGNIPDIVGEYGEAGQTREENTVRLVREAFEKYCPEKYKGKYIDFYFYIGDKPEVAEAYRKLLNLKYIFAYSTVDKYTKVIPLPDFIYIAWKEAGFDSWEDTIEKCNKAGLQKYIDDRLFWIGNAKTHPTREILINLSKQHPNLILAEGMTWLNNKKGEKQKASKYVALWDHAKYKYLIDVQGNGYSGRLKMLFYLHRPIFIAWRPEKEFYFEKLMDLKNCVFVKENYEDLIDKINLLNNNSELYDSIIKNQNELAENVLSKQAAEKYLVDTLIQYCLK